MRRIACLCLVTVASCQRPPAASEPALVFAAEGRPEVRWSSGELAARVAPEEIRGFDPYYGREKRFRALSLRRILTMAFAADPQELASSEFVFRATDGYAAYMRGELAVDDGAYLAITDLDVPAWEPIGPQRAHPGPFYLVWKRPDQADLESHPRPWQLARVERMRFASAYPHTAPAADAGVLAADGYALYRDRCFKCHAMNREGGRVGPDLNVPQNILEYRPEAQVRAYIRDPSSFRFGNMPAHPDLDDAKLDALIGYLRAMQSRKHVPASP